MKHFIILLSLACGLWAQNGVPITKTGSYPVVTSVGSPGVDTNIPSEKAVRTAIGAAGGVSTSGSPASLSASTPNTVALIAGFKGSTGTPAVTLFPIMN